MLHLELDVHTHTVSSGHYTQDTVTDMAKESARQGLKLLGISEHGPAIPHSCTLSYFRGLACAPAMRMGVRILYGAEANIIENGFLDIPDDILKNLDYCIAGMHLPCRRPGTTEQNTKALITAMSNPYIHIIAHPDDVNYPVEYRLLVEAAMDYHVLLEINNSSLSPRGYRGDASMVRENDRAILELCEKYRYPVLLSSDSHGHASIGNFQYALKLIHEIGFPEKLLLNNSAEDFIRFIRR